MRELIFGVDFESRDRGWVSVRTTMHIHFQRIKAMKRLRSLISNDTLLLFPKEHNI